LIRASLNTALIILLLATAPALALSPDAPPPPKYDHPFNGVVRVDHDVAACIKMRPLIPGEIRLGCTDWRKTADAEGLCVVHMLPDKELKRKELKRYGFSRERLLRHHIGHCNGWPDDHSIPSSEPPPAKYDHPFDGVLRVDRDMHDCDEDMGPKKARLACTTGRVAYYDAEKIDDTKSLCIIHMLPDEELRARGFTSEMILRHEVGHCNGWPEDHPME
jgi:hypothetical protein